MCAAGQHGHEPSDQLVARASLRPLTIALSITSLFLVVEVVGGWLTNSLALLADAGHMATDAAALALALFAVWLARRPATPKRSFGYYRAEVLAALVNATALVVVSFLILWEAYQRLGSPPEVQSGPMLAVAVAGLVANAASAWVLARGGGHESDLNTRGAFLHVVSDMLGSVGAIVAALIMLATGWYVVDPLLSAGISLLILKGAWTLLSESANVLMEATPPHIDIEELRAAMVGIEGIANVHDLHVRTVTSGLVAMSGHVEVSGERKWSAILIDAATLLREHFGIAHVTLRRRRRTPCRSPTVAAGSTRWLGGTPARCRRCRRSSESISIGTDSDRGRCLLDDQAGNVQQEYANSDAAGQGEHRQRLRGDQADGRKRESASSDGVSKAGGWHGSCSVPGGSTDGRTRRGR